MVPRVSLARDHSGCFHASGVHDAICTRAQATASTNKLPITPCGSRLTSPCLRTLTSTHMAVKTEATSAHRLHDHSRLLPSGSGASDTSNIRPMNSARFMCFISWQPSLSLATGSSGCLMAANPAPSRNGESTTGRVSGCRWETCWPPHGPVPRRCNRPATRPTAAHL